MDESQSNIDIQSLSGYNDVKNILYRLLQEQLRQPTLMQDIGNDLANCMFNMDYHLLQPKFQKRFDDYMMRLLSGTKRLSLISSDLLDTEAELSVYRQKYEILKHQFDIITRRPDWIEGETEVQVTEDTNDFYMKQYIVRKISYNDQDKEWMCEVSNRNNPNQGNVFKVKQLGKI